MQAHKHKHLSLVKSLKLDINGQRTPTHEPVGELWRPDVQNTLKLPQPQLNPDFKHASKAPPMSCSQVLKVSSQLP